MTVKFSDPTRHNADLHKLGFRTVWMIDPGIGAEKAKHPAGGTPCTRAARRGITGSNAADGDDVSGRGVARLVRVPGLHAARDADWWAGLYKDFMATGIDGVWNDMNEPAVFNVQSKTMPEDNVHARTRSWAGPGTHARFHNVYGMLMVKATREGDAWRRTRTSARSCCPGGTSSGATGTRRRGRATTRRTGTTCRTRCRWR
jgi:alpha-glucosidase